MAKAVGSRRWKRSVSRFAVWTDMRIEVHRHRELDHLFSKEPWGKYNPHLGIFHPLVDHCLDVAVVFRALLDQSNLVRPMASMDPIAKDRLAVIAFPHDFGKCNWGFQAKAEPNTRETAGHVMEALAFLLDSEAERYWPTAWRELLGDIDGWFLSNEQSVQMLFASISHHGRPISQQDIEYWLSESANQSHLRFWERRGDYDPLSALDRLARAARAAFPEAFRSGGPAINAIPELQQRFAGLLMLADWIASDTQFFPYHQSPEEDRLVVAKTAAERAPKVIGLVIPGPRHPKPFAQVFPFQPTNLQTALAENLEISEATRLLLVESDTGSGKTEAALAWFFRLYAENRVDGLYFALPTRVAARELYDRVFRAMNQAFESNVRPGPVLLAAPGYVNVDGQPLLPDPTQTLWDDNQSDQRRERLWSAERPKRFLAAPIAVGTIDQALLSVLQVKHSLLRSVCLDRHLLVVDEVHASDPYMREVLRGLLRGHLARGGWALLLSATLGETAAAEFFEREQVSLDDAIQRAYPLISSHNDTWPVPAARQRTIHVELVPTLEEDEVLIPALIRALKAGARVLVVCNTVRRANTLVRKVEAALEMAHPHLLPTMFALDGVRCPHHGRFAREDRERLDAAVTAQLGKGSPSGARLIIGTQTLEQSLDIDADWLITDLAPMDVLIQRLGRLHRHNRENRPNGFETPHALIRVPAKDLSEYLSEDGELRAPAGLGTVYADGRVLTATWGLLATQHELNLPPQARRLIEHTTHPEALDALPEVWHKHRDLLTGRVQAEVIQAMRALLDDQPFGELHYVDKSERVLTRLGDQTFDLSLTEPMPSPFGETIRRVLIPAHWLADAEIPEVVSAEKTPEGFRIILGNHTFRYTRFGLEPDDAQSPR